MKFNATALKEVASSKPVRQRTDRLLPLIGVVLSAKPVPPSQYDQGVVTRVEVALTPEILHHDVSGDAVTLHESEKKVPFLTRDPESGDIVVNAFSYKMAPREHVFMPFAPGHGPRFFPGKKMSIKVTGIGMPVVGQRYVFSNVELDYPSATIWYSSKSFEAVKSSIESAATCWLEERIRRWFPLQQQMIPRIIFATDAERAACEVRPASPGPFPAEKIQPAPFKDDERFIRISVNRRPIDYGATAEDDVDPFSQPMLVPDEAYCIKPPKITATRAVAVISQSVLSKGQDDKSMPTPFIQLKLVHLQVRDLVKAPDAQEMFITENLFIQSSVLLAALYIPFAPFLQAVLGFTNAKLHPTPPLELLYKMILSKSIEYAATQAAAQHQKDGFTSGFVNYAVARMREFIPANYIPVSRDLVMQRFKLVKPGYYVPSVQNPLDMLTPFKYMGPPIDPQRDYEQKGWACVDTSCLSNIKEGFDLDRAFPGATYYARLCTDSYPDAFEIAEALRQEPLDPTDPCSPIVNNITDPSVGDGIIFKILKASARPESSKEKKEVSESTSLADPYYQRPAAWGTTIKTPNYAPGEFVMPHVLFFAYAPGPTITAAADIPQSLVDENSLKRKVPGGDDNTDAAAIPATEDQPEAKKPRTDDAPLTRD